MQIEFSGGHFGLGAEARPRWAAGLRCSGCALFGAVSVFAGRAWRYRVVNLRVEAAIRQASGTRSREAIR